jgi:hypothetical protein
MPGKLKFLTIALCCALAWSAAAPAQAAPDLSSAGRAAIWRSLRKDAMDTQVAAGLQVGQTVPDPMRVLPFSMHLSQEGSSHQVLFVRAGERPSADRRRAHQKDRRDHL